MYICIRNKNNDIMKGTKEFYELMTSFEELGLESVFISAEVKRESREMFDKGIYYTNGEVNNFFKVFMSGYMNGRLNYMN